MPNFNMYMPNAYNRPGSVIPNRQNYQGQQQFRDGPDTPAMQQRFLQSTGILPRQAAMQPRPVQPGFAPPPGMGNEMRNGVRGGLGLPPIPQGMQQPGLTPAQRAVIGPDMGPLRQIGNQVNQSPQGLPPIPQSMQAPQQSRPAPAPQNLYPVTPQEQARHDSMLNQMNQQQDFLRNKANAYQQNQRYAGAAEGMHSDADTLAMTRPDADTSGVSSQQYFNANPSSMASHYGDRFNAINTNRQLTPQQVGPPPVTQEQFNTRMLGRGIPMPVMAPNESTTKLTPQQAREMSSMGLSPREWQAKQDWAKKNGVTDWNSESAGNYREQVTDPRLQAENARRQQYQDSLHNESMQNMERRNQRLAMGFQRQNIGLFTGGADNTMAQLFNNLNGSPHPLQQQGLTPQQQVQADLQNRNIQLQRADLANSRGDIDQSERIDRTIDQPYMGGQSGGQVGAYGTRPMTPQQAAMGGAVNPNTVSRNMKGLQGTGLAESQQKIASTVDALDSSGSLSQQSLASAGVTKDMLDSAIQDLDGWKQFWGLSPEYARIYEQLNKARQHYGAAGPKPQTPYAPRLPGSSGTGGY